MRPSKFLSILSIFTALLGLAGLALAGAPQVCQVEDGCFGGQCAYPNQGCCEQPAAGCEMPCDCTPRWTFTAEGIVMERTPTRNRAMFTPYPTIGGSLNAQDLNFPVAYGPKVSAIRHADCGWDLEVGYFQLDGFRARTAVPGISGMVTDSSGATLFTTDGEALYDSALYNGEVNVRRQCNDWFTFLAGFRMVELDERYNAAGLEQTLLNSVSTRTLNHLYGLQIGADMEVYNMGGPLRINTLCKAGVFGNTATQDYQRIQGGAVDAVYSADRNQASFLGEAGVVATYALTKRLAFRASAEAMWLTGVALAPEQLGSVDLRHQTASVNTTGAVFYYGGSLGLEYRF
jgi:hypothetical protein